MPVAVAQWIRSAALPELDLNFQYTKPSCIVYCVLCILIHENTYKKN